MKIENQKQLEKLVKLCRTTGIASITVDGITITMGDAPKQAVKAKALEVHAPEALIPVPAYNGVNEPEATSAELTEEQMLMWSVSGESAYEAM